MQKQYNADKVTANAKTETKRGTTKKSYFFAKALVISKLRNPASNKTKLKRFLTILGVMFSIYYNA